MEIETEKYYLSYAKVLDKFKALKIKTKSNKEVEYADLITAINIMNKKHRRCRWKFEKYNSRKKYILVEGYYWLRYVYFQNEKVQIDADISFFEARIKQYEDLLKVKPKKFWNDELTIKDLPNYFDKKLNTVEKAIRKMKETEHRKFIYRKDKKTYLSKDGIEWLCKNCFKTKYLNLLEEYKMELTEKYIEAGYPYDYITLWG